ncbi:preprotein translocase subunit SecE [Williamsia sterculiae]|uniref:Protein translocase subunit SecE n=1 Tax=Williamsia sterculiae TaxID=1344003 RepID=A0A1N7D3H4_9NOCA|nr:preprotein translocase subunit SecE [Williamsia sterculiae]SIR70297.1 preprotein translocase subunit SecE [Williamsia sterculiae]
MSKRDRAIRAKEAADEAGVTKVDDTDVDAADLDGSSGDDAVEAQRPSGKRAAPRGKRSRSEATGTEAADASAVAVKEKKTKKRTGESRNPFVRIWIFLKQVVGELKKVIWPSRREMIQYTIVVLIFVVIMTAIIGGLDVGFAKAVLWLFG